MKDLHPDRFESAPVPARLLNLCRQIDGLNGAGLDLQENLYAKMDSLLEQATPEETAAVLSEPEFLAMRDRLHNIRAQYEFLREYDVAKRVLALADDGPELGFRSAEMYDAAVLYETALIRAEAGGRVLFIGAGPYPVTSIAYSRIVPDAHVVCIDRDPTAYEMADAIARKLGCDNLEVRHGDGITDPDFSAFDVVIVGLMIGVTDEEKTRDARRILARARPRHALFFRSAVGAGRIIWPSLTAQRLGDATLQLMPGGPENTFALLRAD